MTLRRCKLLIKCAAVRFMRSDVLITQRGYHNLINNSSEITKLSILNNSQSAVLFRRFSNSSRLKMRFVQFTQNGGPQRLGVQISLEGDVIDISGVDSTIPNNLVQFLQEGPSMLERAKRVVGEAKSTFHLSDIKLLPPVTNPSKVVCVGLNYSGHCDEQNVPYPKEPVFFSKFPSCIVGPYDNVVHPPITKALDWEVELATVISKTVKDIKPVEATDCIFGFTVAQDITARDWQKRNGGQWLLGKSMDTFCPLGPAVVIKEAVADVNALGIRSKVNDVIKQNGNTSELIHKIDYLISFLSHCVTLYPGDMILTGTPAGVGVFRNPREFLKPGDVIESEIDGIGKLKNKVV